MNKGLLKVARYLAAKGFYKEAAQVKKLAGWREDLKADQRGDDIRDFVANEFGSFEGEGGVNTEGTHNIIGRKGLGKTHPADRAAIDMENMVKGFEELEKDMKALFDVAKRSAIRNDQLGFALGLLHAWCTGCKDALKSKQGWITAPSRPMYTQAKCEPYNMDELIPVIEKTTRDILYETADEAAQKDPRSSISILIERIQTQVEGLNEMMPEIG